jgi:hypothetical protein
MDVKINAYGKQIDVIGIDCDDAADCLETVLDYWERIEDPRLAPPSVDDNERPIIEASGGGYHERKHQTMGFAEFTYGERVNGQ